MSTNKYQIFNTVAARIGAEMKKKGITQQQLADACDVQQGTISNWLNGNAPKSLEVLAKIAEVLEVEPGRLLLKETLAERYLTSKPEIELKETHEAELEAWRRRAKTAEKRLHDLKLNIKNLIEEEHAES